MSRHTNMISVSWERAGVGASQDRIQPAIEDLVWIPGGTFLMGSDKHYIPFDDARPIHTVDLDGFWMDEAPVTNAEFAQFVNATGYVTTAERKPTAKELPDVPEDNRVAGAVVFTPPKNSVSLDDASGWWTYVPGANWRHPEGPASSLKGRAKHPLVQVAYEDAEAYANWAGKGLPTEAEWEFAARGGLEGAEFVWGAVFLPRGNHKANTWQGEFPWRAVGLRI